MTTVVGSATTTPIGFDVTPRGPSINNSGVSVFSATHAVLYFYDRGALEVVAAPGNPSPGVGTLGSIIVPAIRQSSLAYAAVDGGGSLIALKKGRNAPIQVVHSGDPAPGGGTFDLGSNLRDVRGSKVLFQSGVSGGVAPTGLFRVDTQNGQVDTLALEGDMAPSGAFFDTFLAVHAAGGEAAFVATLTGFVEGIFLTSHLGPRQVVLEGDIMPDTGGGTLDGIGPVAVSGSRVAFMGSVSGGTVSDGLFLWNGHGRITRLVSEGDPAVGGETFSSLLNGVSAGLDVHLSVTKWTLLRPRERSAHAGARLW